MAPPELQVQVFGRHDSRPTQKCLRFFSERRVKVAFVDIARKPPAPTELRRFAQRLGARTLLDDGSSTYRDAGLAYLSMDDDAVLERVMRDPRLLRLPLVRAGSHVSIGVDEDAWSAWLES